MAIFAKRLLPDPLPRRFGEVHPGMLTKGELKGVKAVLAKALGGHYRKQDVSLWEKRSSDWSEDEHTAFVSLLHSGYIRETYADSGRYRTTDAGKEYAESLDLEPAPGRRR